MRPTIAQVGDCLILSSTEGLTVDLIDALEKEGAGPIKPLSGLHSILEVDGPPLASILRKNREGMVRNNMVEKGNSREQAESEMGLLLDVMRFFDGADLTLGSTGGRPEAVLRVKMRRPGEDSSRTVREEPERAARVAGGSEEGNHDR